MVSKKKSEIKKHSVSLFGIFIANYLLGLGIAAIGRQTDNEKEFYGGLLFALVFIILVYHQLALGYEIGVVREALVVPFSLLSWAYIVVRLVMLRGKVQYKII